VVVHRTYEMFWARELIKYTYIQCIYMYMYMYTHG